MRSSAIFEVVASLRCRLVQNHEPTVQSQDGLILVAYAFGYVLEFNAEVIPHLGNVLRFRPRVPGHRTFDVPESKIGPEALAIWIYGNWKPA